MSGDPTPFAGTEEAARAGRQSGKTERREVTCPKCGGEFGNLPQHLRACDGEAVTDGGFPSDSRPAAERRPQWSRPGGEGLPLPDSHDADEFWLFTCCQCGRRWVDPPGPPRRCSCESTEIVCHRFEPDVYWNIKRYGDPHPPVTDGGRIHDAVDGGFVCHQCGTVRQTPLGMARHRSLCRRREGQHDQ